MITVNNLNNSVKYKEENIRDTTSGDTYWEHLLNIILMFLHTPKYVAQTQKSVCLLNGSWNFVTIFTQQGAKDLFPGIGELSYVHVEDMPTP